MREGLFIAGVAAFLALAGCGSSGSSDVSNTGGTTSSSGKSSSGGSGGISSNSSSRRATDSGGSASSGGVSASGGKSQAGGSKASGGKTSGGGVTSSDATSSGGAASSGGQTATSSANGGATASGGSTGGGGSATGGTTASSSSSESRDAAVDVAPDAELCKPGGTCTEPNLTVTDGTGTHCCYTYENWINTGSATMTLKTDGFSVNWTGSTQFVGRKGIRPGDGKIVTEYTANFSPNGNSYLCLYGWTTEPLAEYYVVDGWGSWRPPGGTAIGTVTSDGGTYDIYKMTRTDEPSIIGKATFPQYWSVRQQKKTSGTITLANHIAAWAGKGMPMGTFYEVSMTVEGYQSNGTADVKFSMK